MSAIDLIPTAADARNDSERNQSSVVAISAQGRQALAPITEAISKGHFSATLPTATLSMSDRTAIKAYVVKMGYTVMECVDGNLTVSWGKNNVSLSKPIMG